MEEGDPQETVENNPKEEEDPLDDLEPADEIPEPPLCARCAGHGGEMSYDEVNQLALDARTKIDQLVGDNAQLMERINTHQCPAVTPHPAAPSNGVTESRAALESQVEELKAAIEMLKEENELLRTSEERLMNMVGVQDRERQEKESEEIQEMRKKVKEQADLLAKQKMVIQTMRAQIERLSKKK